MNADVLVLATHPDDAEIGCGGTILRLAAAGKRVVIADMSRGEKATRGTPETRAEESAAATQCLAVEERVNLGLPDTDIRDDEPALRAVIEVVRRTRPALFFIPLRSDAHPDHEATNRVARRAFFHAGLQNVMSDLGAPHRPRVMLEYFGNDHASPTICVDISSVVERKRAAIACYGSQLGAEGKAHFVRGIDPLARCEARDRYFGSVCGFESAEPFWHDGPLPLFDMTALLLGGGP